MYLQFISGSACLTNPEGFFNFNPDFPTAGTYPSFRKHGFAQQLSDGNFEFVPRSWPRAETTLIRKLPHGRVSLTKSGDFLLTLKVSADEIQASRIIAREALQAADSVSKYSQLNTRRKVA